MAFGEQETYWGIGKKRPKNRKAKVVVFYVWSAVPKCVWAFVSKFFANAEKDTDFKCCIWNYVKKLTLPEMPNVQKTSYVSVGELCLWYSVS